MCFHIPNIGKKDARSSYCSYPNLISNSVSKHQRPPNKKWPEPCDTELKAARTAPRSGQGPKKGAGLETREKESAAS